MATSIAVAAILIGPTPALADTDVGGLLGSALDQLTIWLQRIVFRLAVPVAIVGAILLMLGFSSGRRILWATVIAVFIAIFARPLLQALPSIVSGATFP